MATQQIKVIPRTAFRTFLNVVSAGLEGEARVRAAEPGGGGAERSARPGDLQTQGPRLTAQGGPECQVLPGAGMGGFSPQPSDAGWRSRC